MTRRALVLLAFLGCSCGGNAENDSSAGGAGGTGGASGGAGGGGAGGTGGSAGSTGGAGGSAGSTGGAGGSAGTAGAGGTGGVVPAECRSPSTEAGPHRVTFRLQNTSPQAVYLLEECTLRFDITACADDHAARMTIAAFCSGSCDEPDNGCIVCGACLYEGREVAPNTTTSAEWGGQTFTFSQTSNGCQCHETHVAPNARYRITVPIWNTQDAATMEPPAREVSVDFDVTDGVVDVELGI